MKKIATFTYGVVFALGMSLIALLVVVAIGKYDYKWEYTEDLPHIDPIYGTVESGSESGDETTKDPNSELMSNLVISDVGSWHIDGGRYKCGITINAHDGAATISYIEYTLYRGNVCYGVYYESFSDDPRNEKAYMEPDSVLVWTASLPYEAELTLLRVKIVWTDTLGNIGENTVTVDYPAIDVPLPED